IEETCTAGMETTTTSVTAGRACGINVLGFLAILFLPHAIEHILETELADHFMLLSKHCQVFPQHLKRSHLVPEFNFFGVSDLLTFTTEAFEELITLNHGDHRGELGWPFMWRLQ